LSVVVTRQNDDQESQLIHELEREIIDYLSRHPDAADGREGIFQFWILRERFRCGLFALDQALARLVASGQLEEVKLRDGHTIFRSGNVNGD
jgi:hypothetical protein